jgi:aspartyl-tRNA(Asn)/glutamyl-tRNA(Gln) amidotransferase subunit C
MSLTSEQVEHIAKLARLELVEAEKEDLRARLSSILEYVSQLQEIDTAAVEPMTYVAEIENVWGEDEVAACPPEERQGVIDGFPEKEGNLLKVKAVFK